MTGVRGDGRRRGVWGAMGAWYTGRVFTVDNFAALVAQMGLHPDAERIAEIVVKLLAALTLSGAVGMERQRKGRNAGLRTHILVCLGATLMMMISEYISREAGGGAAALDRARIAAGIITGIGFLGAGTIMKSGQEKVGLTTAATVWFAAAQGIAIGAGYLITPLIATVFVLLVVVGLSAFEQILPQRGSFLLTMQLPATESDLGRILSHIESSGPFEVQATSIKESEEENRLQVSLQIRSRSTRDFAVLAELLRNAYPHAQRISLERMQA